MNWFYLLAPKVFGLVITGILIYEECRKSILMHKKKPIKGTIIKIEKNEDITSTLNKIAHIEFYHNGQYIMIKHFFSSTKDQEEKEVFVYVNEKKPERSVAGSKPKYIISWLMVFSIFFFLLITYSIFKSL